MQKNYKIGLKLWSVNTDFYYEEAQKLYNQGYFDYIELYAVPNSLETVSKWERLDIPFILHAPHFMHEVNLADPDKFEYNRKIYGQVEIFRKALNAEYTIVHAGMNGRIEETVRQLKLISPKNFLIENKPAHPPYFESRICRGHSAEEISHVINETNCQFCLDISHAFCTANHLNIPPYEFLENFNQLSPVMYHLSDGDIASPHDQHLNIGMGNYDFKKIFSIINNKPISLETQKKSKEDLNDFINDSLTIKKIMSYCDDNTVVPN